MPCPGKDSLHSSCNDDDTSWDDPSQWPPITEDMIPAAVRKGIALPKLTRKRLIDTPDWPQFKGSEWVQLNKYHKQGMFGEPCPRPTDPDTVILPWVWSYLYKLDPVSLEDVEKS